MSEFPKTISAPALSPTYGQNVKETFQNVDDNFKVLANRELYKGEPGKNIISVSVPWSSIFETDGNDYVSTITIGDYTINNFAIAIITKLRRISNNDDDITATINQLKSNGWSIVVCFSEPELESASTPVNIETCIPFVYVDYRFRIGLNETTLVQLADKTDMSCVITCNSTNGWDCTQNFPTLYYDGNDNTLYWNINGQNTKILAQGPKGIDGKNGFVYIGLSDNMKLYPNGAQGGENGGTLNGNTENVEIEYLLCNLKNDPADPLYDALSPNSKAHFPFIEIADWVTLNGSDPVTAPILILSANALEPVTIGGQIMGVPYYVATTSINHNQSVATVSCTVSKYNICYSYMTDLALQQAMKTYLPKNVLRLPNGALGTNEIAGYSIKERTPDNTTKGYCIFVPYNGIMTLAYVDDVEHPEVHSTEDTTNDKFLIVGSVAEGWGTTAGNYAHAEGIGTTASGEDAHAEGYQTIASEDDAHAEGNTTTASGISSHAEGFRTKASGAASHAEGYAEKHTTSPTTYSGTIEATYAGAHAEGYAGKKDSNANPGKISAAGLGAHAEGYAPQGSTIEAKGTGSHAEGCNTKAYGDYSHAEGNKTTAGVSSDRTISGSHAEGDTTIAKGAQSHAEGYNTKAYGQASHTEGHSTIAGFSGETGDVAPGGNTGNQSHAEGYGTKAKGAQSHAEGNQTTATGVSSHAEGSSTTASGIASHAEGMSTQATNNESHAEGYGTNAQGSYSHAEGQSTTASNDASHAEGKSTTASGSYSHAEGQSTIASNDASHAEGKSTTASGSYSHAEGESTTAYSKDSHAEGHGTTAGAKHATQNLYSGNYAHAEGSGTAAQGEASHAEGYQTTAGNGYGQPARGAHAEGEFTNAQGDGTHAEGYGTTARGGEGAHAEGRDTTASAIAAHAEGRNTTASEVGAHAEGYGNYVDSESGLDATHNGKITASGSGSHAEGYAESTYETDEVGGKITASGSGSHAEGYAAANTELKATGTGAHAEGAGTTASGDYSHAEGYGSTASGTYSHAEGYGSTAGAQESHAEGSSTANGDWSHAEGHSTAAGDYSHAEGQYTTVYSRCNYGCHAEGYGTKVGDGTHDCDYGAHAEGHGTMVIADSAHAEGIGTRAGVVVGNEIQGEAAHAEGNGSHAYGNYSHAEGKSTEASGKGAHAEGKDTIASGSQAHAEGEDTTASGSQAHAEGDGTTASGRESHAEGNGSHAYGFRSHTEGYNTTAEGWPTSLLFGYIGDNGNYSNQIHIKIKAVAVSLRVFNYSTLTQSDQQAILNLFYNFNLSDLNFPDITGYPDPNKCEFNISPVPQGTPTTDAQFRLYIKNRLYAGLGPCLILYWDEPTSVSESTSSKSISTNLAWWENALNIVDQANYDLLPTIKGQLGTTHAEGESTTASGPVSHAEGISTTASGIGSHAEGDNTTASGNYSHAEGSSTTASGHYSHASGLGCIAKHSCETAMGMYNTPGYIDTSTAVGGSASISSTSGSSLEPIIFSVGIGQSSTNTLNAFFCTTSGHFWVLNSSGQYGTSAVYKRLA